MGYTVRQHIPAGEIRRLIQRYRATPGVLEAVAFFMVQQTRDRFRTGGASGGTAWVPKKARSWGFDDGRALLTGKTARLLDSYQGYGTDARAVLFSDDPKSKLHQLGTVGAGGVLPTIRPRKAKALFIPLTDRAQDSDRLTGPPAAWVRSKGGDRSGSEAPLRAAVRQTRSGGLVYSPLVKGRLKDGRLQKWDQRRGEYVDGVPDFIFLSKADIPPRPMLPTGADERTAQVQFFLDQLTRAAERTTRRRGST